MPHSSLRILGRSKPSLTVLIALLVVAALLFAIPRMILPRAQSAFLQSLGPVVWADCASPYDLVATVVAASTLVIFLLRR